MSDDFDQFFNVPGRPEHPDFMKLSDVILKLDGRATEGGESFQDIVQDVIDVESLSYMAQKRIRWAYPNISDDGAQAMAAMFLNGFLAGFFWFDRRVQGRTVVPLGFDDVDEMLQKWVPDFEFVVDPRFPDGDEGSGQWAAGMYRHGDQLLTVHNDGTGTLEEGA